MGRARLPESYAPAPRDALHLRGPSAAQMRDDQQEHYSRHRSWSPAASPLDGDFRGHHWREQRVAYGQGAHPDHPAARRFPLRPVPDALPGDGRPHHLGPAHEWLPPEGRAGYPPAPEPRGGQRRLPPWTDSPHPHGDPFRHRGGAAGGRGDDPLRLYGSRGPAGDVPGMALHHPPPGMLPLQHSSVGRPLLPQRLPLLHTACRCRAVAGTALVHLDVPAFCRPFPPGRVQSCATSWNHRGVPVSTPDLYEYQASTLDVSGSACVSAVQQ